MKGIMRNNQPLLNGYRNFEKNQMRGFNKILLSYFSAMTEPIQRLTSAANILVWGGGAGGLHEQWKNN